MRRQNSVIRGFYSSAAGMLGLLEQQDAISNNLANCSTPGFKRSSVSFTAFSTELERVGRGPSETSPTQAPLVIPLPFEGRDSSQGLMEDTSTPTNLAIDGPGFFVVKTARGERLTRSGDFRLNDSGQLCTTEGELVLGQNGPVRASGGTLLVDADGTVRVDGAVVDKLRIAVPGQRRTTSGAAEAGRIAQGRLENSNVSAVREMVSMITALRAYEASQRTIQALDQTLDKVINLAGRTA